MYVNFQHSVSNADSTGICDLVGHCFGCEVLTAVSVGSAVFWDVCNAVSSGRARLFGGTRRLHQVAACFCCFHAWLTLRP
jgi:hypothetical protein